MSIDIWDDEGVSEYDLLKEQAQEAEEIAEEYSQTPIVIEADDEELEEVHAAAAFDLDKEESNTVYNARLRLEQARLYEMLINHPLFEGVDADPRAIQVVQSELKYYLVRRLEVLVGLHQPVEKKIPSSEVFNDIEADFLKQLAYKGTKGASTQAESVVRPRSQPSGLKPLVSNSRKNTPKPIVKTTPAPRPKVQAQSTAPVARQRRPKKSGPRPKDKLVKNTGEAPRELTRTEVEKVARKDLEDMKRRKPWAKMTKTEKVKEIKEVNNKHPRPATEGGVPPIMTYEEQERKYMMQQAMVKPNTMGDLNNTIARIMIKKRTENE